VQLVDVREPWEHDEAHIPGCRLIPLGDVPLRYGEIDRDTPVVVYCKSGGRSAKAVAFLREQGYENTFNLSGGILAWANDQLPIE
jgi:rhodanese-related sulfurtransferase